MKTNCEIKIQYFIKEVKKYIANTFGALQIKPMSPTDTGVVHEFKLEVKYPIKTITQMQDLVKH